MNYFDFFKHRQDLNRPLPYASKKICFPKFDRSFEVEKKRNACLKKPFLGYE